MCTLTYIPHSTGYTFTHNRDERMDRPSSDDFRKKNVDAGTIYFPQDLEAMGTWIGFSNQNLSACILNGGKAPYQRKRSYRKSRGLVVLESLEKDNPQDFYSSSNFEGIEPFTLILRSKHGLFAIIHDENKTELEERNPDEEHIWSSTTLYTSEVRNKREEWFARWLSENRAVTPGSIRNFHLNAGEGDKTNDLVMSRWGILKTVSITQISVMDDKASLFYHNLQSNLRDSHSGISLK